MLVDDADAADSSRMGDPIHPEDPTRPATGAVSRPPRSGVTLRTVLRALVGLAVVVLAVALVRTTYEARTTGFAWAWDETMHAELPAVRMILHAQRGEFAEVSDVVQDCDQYPFVHPICLAVWQAVFGIGEHQARTLGLWTFLLVTLVGVARLARRVALAGDREPGERRRRVATDVALLAVLAAVASPLARRYAPTLFLEGPSLVTIVFALEAWLARRDARSDRERRRRDWITGAWIALAFFTKFNYGLMLIGALALDGVVDLARAGDRAAAFRSQLRVFTPLAVTCVWWFFLPLPGSLEDAAAHREAFLGFVSGNREMVPIPDWLRRTNWLTGVAAHSLLFGAMVLAGGVGMLVLRSRATATMAFALVLFVAPVMAHPFQLDRFLLPAALVIWVMAAVAVGHWFDRSPITLGVAAAIVTALCLSISNFRTTTWVGLPVAREGTGSRAFQEEHVNVTLGVFGPPATTGLTRGTQQRLLDLVAGAVGPTDRVGWLGQSAEMSPASLHMGLLERGGTVERFLRDAQGPMDLDPVPKLTHSNRTDADVLAFAEGFDHLLLCEFGDLKNRAQRRWIKERWHRPIEASDAYEIRSLGIILVDRPVLGPMPVEIRIASRR